MSFVFLSTIARSSLEPGLEALLRSAGGSLLHLSVSECPDILTERTLWLSSCYCRNLEIVTYRCVCCLSHVWLIYLTSVSAFLTVCVLCRSSSHPPTQEVLWALGAGCRNISSLHVAPSYPWSVHTPPYSIVICEWLCTLQKKWVESSLFLFTYYYLQPANHRLRRSLPADDWSMLATAAIAQCWRSRLWDSGTGSARSVTGKKIEYSRNNFGKKILCIDETFK